MTDHTHPAYSKPEAAHPIQNGRPAEPDFAREPTMPTCRICNKSGNGTSFTAREMMHGSKEEFEYYECHECGSIQIAEIPEDLGRYYQNNYWQFAKIDDIQTGFLNALSSRKRASYWMFERRNLLGKLMARGHKKPRYLNWLNRDGITFDSRILDVGSGPGELVVKVANGGFKRVDGLDLFIDHDIHYRDGVTVYKNDLDHFTGEYDFIMLHHSFEHMPEPRQVLTNLHRLLAPKGWLLIRIPVSTTYAWRHYRENWVQLDPPRHLHLFSPASMEALADEAGFDVEEVRYDSEPVQFWGSEQYIKDISLFADNSHEVNEQASLFSTEQIDEFRHRAHALNAKQDGDQAAFFLRRRD